MLKAIVEELKRRGHRITGQRQLIIEAVLTLGESRFTIDDVFKKIKAMQQETGLDTIYRNINLLTEAGFLTSIGGVGKEGLRYELAGLKHHHHVVCMHCGEAQCIDYCPLDETLLRLVEERGYDLIRHQLDLIGVCKKCRK